MKYYEQRGHFWLGLFLTVVGIGMGCIYWKGIESELKSLNKGIPVQATIVEIDFIMTGSNYMYTAKAEYENPITQTRVINILGGYEAWMDVGEVVDAYYIASEELLLYKNAKVKLINSHLLYILVFGGGGLWLISWWIYKRIHVLRLIKANQKIIAEIIDFNNKKNIITCKYVKDKKEWLFYRSHIDIKRLKNGISLGMTVPVYTKGENYKSYHIAIEEVDRH